MRIGAESQLMCAQNPLREGLTVWKEGLALGVILIGIGLLHGYFLREGHLWGDDFAQYLMHAKNLAEGRPYGQIGYIYNPHYPELGPPAYPPGTALLLVPIWWLWGLNWTAMKGMMILCLLIWLGVVGWYFRKEVPLPVRLCLVGLVGLNHFFLDQTNSVGSDLPFLVWLYLSLWLVQKAEPPQQAGRSVSCCPCKTGLLTQKLQEEFAPEHAPIPPRRHKSPATRVWYLGAAVASWAAFGTRSIGLVVWAAIVLADWWQFRRLRSPLLWTTGLFVLLAGLLLWLIPGTTGYLDQISFDPIRWGLHMVQYGRQLAAFWKNPLSPLLAAALAAVLTLLAAVSYFRQWRQKVSAREIFVLLYASAVLLWPSYQGFRMLNPLIPFWLFYAWLGLEELRQRWKAVPLGLRIYLARALTVGLAAGMVVCYVSVLLSRPTGPLPEGIGRPSSQALFQAVEKHTQPEDVLIFIKPRALALLTGRRCSVYPPVQTDAELWNYFTNIQAHFLVVLRRPEALQGAEKRELVQLLADFAARNEHRLQPVWTNEDFALYRIQNITSETKQPTE